MQFAHSRNLSIIRLSSCPLLPTGIRLRVSPTVKSSKEPYASGLSSLAQYSFALALLGATAGTVLDAIHSNVSLQRYEQFPISLGPIHTSLVVPPLLSLFYLTVGLLFLTSDHLLQEEHKQRPKLETVLQGFLILGLELELSASLYAAAVPYGLISVILATAFLFNWAFFDRTKQGLAIAILCGLVAPIAELGLNRAVELSSSHLNIPQLPLWTYDSADFYPIVGLDGIVSWVPWCYAFYTPILGHLSRYLAADQDDDWII
jgi:hypothetical protein